MTASDAMEDEVRAGAPDEPRLPGCGEEGFVRNDDDKASRSRFTLVCAFSCAWEGVRYAVKTQRNMKIHLAVAAAAVALGAALSIDAASWAAIAVCIALVIAAECVNTAVESAIDLVSPGYAELAKRAKDCAAAAVLVCALGAVAVAVAVFLPRIVACIGL